MCSYCGNQLLRQVKHISWFLTFTTFSLVIIQSLHFRWLFSIDFVWEWFKCFPSVFLLHFFRSSLVAGFITVWLLGESLHLIHFQNGHNNFHTLVVVRNNSCKASHAELSTLQMLYQRGSKNQGDTFLKFKVQEVSFFWEPSLLSLCIICFLFFFPREDILQIVFITRNFHLHYPSSVFLKTEINTVCSCETFNR